MLAHSSYLYKVNTQGGNYENIAHQPEMGGLGLLKSPALCGVEPPFGSLRQK